MHPTLVKPSYHHHHHHHHCVCMGQSLLTVRVFVLSALRLCCLFSCPHVKVGLGFTTALYSHLKHFSDVHLYRASYDCYHFRLKPVFSNVDGQKLNKECSTVCFFWYQRVQYFQTRGFKFRAVFVFKCSVPEQVKFSAKLFATFRYILSETSGDSY